MTVVEPLVEIVSATRLSAEQFWQKTALGQSLQRLVQSQPFKVSVAVNNTQGLPVVYNRYIKADSRSDYLVFVHDDVWIQDFFLEDRLREAFRQFELVGLAGNTRRVAQQPAWCFSGRSAEGFVPDARQYLSGRVAHGKGPLGMIANYGETPKSCELMDGLFLAARRSFLRQHEILFDEQFPFHFYDLDLCRSFRVKQFAIGTWPISVTHQSTGSYGTPEWKSAYERYLAKWGS